MLDHKTPSTPQAAKPPLRKMAWLARDIAVERRADGPIVLQSRTPLQAYERHLPASRAKWAIERPDRTWLAQRTGGDRPWRRLSWVEAKRTVDALTQGLLDLQLAPGSVVAILSGNSIEPALMTQAAMQARLPVADDVVASIDAITPDTVGKLLFTSGSTGMPKAVINTQKMMCANVAMGSQVRRYPEGHEAICLHRHLPGH